MGWLEDLQRVLERLPEQFSLLDVYRYTPFLHERHPENRHIRDKIRQQLQILRDKGDLEFEGDGKYRQRLAHRWNPNQRWTISPGTVTTRDKLAAMMGLASNDALRRGMFKAAEGPMSAHLLLFHDERENPYGDVIEEDRVQYVGQGRAGDQKLESFNRYLAEHLDRGLKVHYFTQPKETPGLIRYHGQVVVDGPPRRVFRAQEGRSVLLFTLVPVKDEREEPVARFGNDFAEILEYASPPGPIRVPRRISLSSRVSRDAAFRRALLWLYQNQCCVCGNVLRRDRLSELEGAHIMAVSEDGPDDPRNGLSLCGRHHWAFDNGFFTIDAALKLKWLAADLDPHGEIVPGERISLPRDDDLQPHPNYLRTHWKKWQVGN